MRTTVKKDKDSVNEGHNAKRIREIMGIDQNTLAKECGWSRQYQSKLENSEHIDDNQLKIIAEKLGVTSEFIKNFKEEKAIYNIVNNSTFGENSSQQYQPVIHNHSVGNVVELFEQIINDHQKGTEFIQNIGKVVADLAEEIEKLKRRKV